MPAILEFVKKERPSRVDFLEFSTRACPTERIR
jgi:hypothetical protein